MGDKKNIKKKNSIFDDDFDEVEELEELEEKPKHDEDKHSKKEEKHQTVIDDNFEDLEEKPPRKEEKPEKKEKTEEIIIKSVKDDEEDDKKSEKESRKSEKVEDKKKNVVVKKVEKKSKFEDDDEDDDDDEDSSLGIKAVLGVIIIAIIVVLLLKSCSGEETQYTIKFDANGGSEVTEVVVDEDGTISKPADPTKEGYEFAGWYYNDELYDFSKPVTGNITLEARWAELANVSGVTLDQTSIKLSPGGTTTLVATVLPENAYNKSLTWKSSNTDVVTVDENGNITGVKAGKATITVTTVDGEFTAEATVTVSADVVAVTDVKLNKTSLELSPNESSTLTATVAPSDASNKGVTWTSSNTDVATVSSTGKVTAKKDGTTVITVTTKDGSFKATCNVTVKTVKVTGVRVNSDSVTLKEGKSTTVTATVAPTNATNKKVTWKSEDTTIATVSSAGKITGVKAGTTKVTVTTADGNFTKTITVTVKAPVLAESVEINGTNEVQEGKTITLKATVKPTDADDKSVTWTSSDKTIATVSDSGKVKGVKPGKVTITATTKNGKTDTFEVTVTEKPATYTVKLEANYTGSEISSWAFTVLKNNSALTKDGFKGLTCGSKSVLAGAGTIPGNATESATCTVTLLDGTKVTANATWKK